MNSQYNLLPYDTLQYNLTNAIEFTIVNTQGTSDARTVSASLQKTDNSVLVDSLSKQVTEKVLSETVKANIWFTEKNAPQSDPWS